MELTDGIFVGGCFVFRVVLGIILGSEEVALRRCELSGDDSGF